MLDPDIQALVELGDNIAAVGLYQQRHGGSVLVARKAIEAARWALTQSRGAALDSAGVELDALIQRGDTIEAIKRYRELHGVGLQEAREAVEVRAAALRAAAPAPAATVLNDPQLDQALRAGRKIEAIKRYRELHGVGLKEAKDAVEAIQAGTTPAPPSPAAAPARPALQPELDRLIAADQKIMAIKHYREVTGVGLKEAKDAVEARMAENPNASSSPPGLQPELDRLLAAGQLIPAIKHYRAVIPSSGLKEAKDAVEARNAERLKLQADAVQASLPALQPELDRLIHAGQKIMAIKHWRECTHAGLKEAKDAVEARMAELGR